MVKSTLQPSPKAVNLVDDFATASCDWGWQADQGVGPEVDRSEEQYKATKAKLLRYIALLERQVRGD